MVDRGRLGDDIADLATPSLNYRSFVVVGSHLLEHVCPSAMIVLSFQNDQDKSNQSQDTPAAILSDQHIITRNDCANLTRKSGGYPSKRKLTWTDEVGGENGCMRPRQIFTTPRIAYINRLGSFNV